MNRSRNSVFKWKRQTIRQAKAVATPKQLKRPEPRLDCVPRKRARTRAADAASIEAPVSPAPDRAPVRGSDDIQALANRLACGRTESLLMSLSQFNPFRRSSLEDPSAMSGLFFFGGVGRCCSQVAVCAEV